MNEHLDFEAGFEPERYELDESPFYRFELDRRAFLQTLGGGLLVFFLLDKAPAQDRRRGGPGRGGGPQEIGAWLHIGEDGKISVFTGKAEVGQNIRTSLTQVVAEELHTDPATIQMVMADTQLTPFDAGTFGSRTTPDMAPRLRRMAAGARERLLDLAAEHWNADRSSLTVANGEIVNPANGETLDFGTLTKGQKITQAVSDNVPTTPPEEWSIAGQSLQKVNGRDFVTGAHRYTSDIKRPNMWHAKVLRPTAFNATLSSIDTSAAEMMSDVAVVRDGDFVGVAAPSEHMASKAIEAIQSSWDSPAQISNRELYDTLKEETRGDQGGRGGSGQQEGSIEDGLAEADVTLEESYNVAYIAHAPLEPRAAVAEWENGKLTVWTGSQRPFGVQGELARAFNLDEADVRVIVPDTGSGYGGKHTGEAALEAARIAREVGRPVKLVWTREEEFTWAYFRPAGVIDIKSGVRSDGTLTAWEYHNYNSGGSAIRTPYDVLNQRIEFHPSRAPLRQGSYRALATTANVFARESHMDELAEAVGMDPLEFRLKNLKDERLRAVLEAAAEAFGWGKEPPSNHGVGIACGFDKGGYVATCAEVTIVRPRNQLRVTRALSAFECGAILNPDHLKNQIEGAMVQGLGGAVFEEIDFRDGTIVNPKFSQYRVPRFRDSPEIEVVLLDRKDLPSAGAGETPIAGIAPAVGNAIFNATGRRLRDLPLAPRGVRG